MLFDIKKVIQQLKKEDYVYFTHCPDDPEIEHARNVAIMGCGSWFIVLRSNIEKDVAETLFKNMLLQKKNIVTRKIEPSFFERFFAMGSANQESLEPLPIFDNINKHECQLFYNQSHGIITFNKKYTDIFKMNEITWYTTSNNGPAFTLDSAGDVCAVVMPYRNGDALKDKIKDLVNKLEAALKHETVAV